jgi:hypothetical protein
MIRPLSLIGALFLAFLIITPACLAEGAEWIRFTLEPERGNSTKIHASFRDEGRARGENEWSTGFDPSDLVGLDGPSFRGAGTRSIRFAIVREAGRLDCTGSGGSGRADGNCRFTADPAFTQLLISHGIGHPTQEQAFGLMAVNARREVIDAVAAAHYPTPTIDNLIAVSALGVDGPYITGMARAGYRPESIQKLIEFKALGIAPDWIAGFARIGYANVPAGGLVQLRALGVTPEYIEGFQRLGYRNLSSDKLVELKALNVTPEFVRSVVQSGAPLPPVSELVELKMFGRRR